MKKGKEQLKVNNDEINLDVNLKTALLGIRDGGFTIKDDEGNPIKIGKQDLKITKLDLIDFSGISDKYLEEIIYYQLGIKINTQAGINKFNTHFQTALGIYSATRAKPLLEKRWGITFDEISKYYPFHNKKAILNFLRLAENKDGLGKIACFVSKLTYAVIDILNTPGLADLEREEEKIFKRFEGPLSISQSSSDEGEYIGNIGGKKFVMYGRPKSLRSSAEKITGNPDYNTAENIKDGIGYTFEIDGNDEDVLILMQSIFNVVRAVGGKIDSYDNKGVKLFNQKNYNKFDLDFINFINTKPQKSGKKGATSEGYKEIKLQGTIRGIKFEIKFTNKGNKNQDGLNLQSVYEYLNKHIEGSIVRNGGSGYIKSDEIADLVQDFFDRLDINIQKNPEKRGTPRKQVEKELWDDLQKGGFIGSNLKYENAIIGKNPKIYNHLIPGLRKYYESKLVRVQLKNKEEVFTSLRGLELSKSGYYPKMTLVN